MAPQLPQDIRTLGAQTPTLQNRVDFWKAVIQYILYRLPGGFIIADVVGSEQTSPSRRELRILQDNAAKISGLVAVNTTDADAEVIAAQQQTSLPVTFFTTNGTITFYRLGLDFAIGELANLDPTNPQELERIEDNFRLALKLG